MFACQRTEFFFHLAVGHRIFEMTAMVFNPNRFALSGFENKFKVAQVVVAFV